MNENVKELLENHMWDLATCLDNKPNVVPVAFKEVTEDGKLVIGDVFLDTTLKNIAGNNGSIAISVYDDKKLEGYQIKGTASYTTSGVLVDKYKKIVEDMFHGAATCKGILTVTPETIIVTTPGPENKKVL